MTVLIAIPVIRVSCRVGIDKGRAWSVFDELLLWAVTRQSRTVEALSRETRLPPQIIVASIARLMRFRLVEVMPNAAGAAFRASEFGFNLVTSGKPLPFFPKRQSRRTSFVIECVSGEFFPGRDVRLANPRKLDIERAQGADIRVVRVQGGGPSVSHEANLRRLADIVARGMDEEVAAIDSRTASLREDELMVVRVVDGVMRGLPEKAGPGLRQEIERAAAMQAGTREVTVAYSGPREEAETTPIVRSCAFDPADIVIGGSEQRACLLELLKTAHRRVIIHSTFLDASKFEDLIEPIHAACHRGVTFDLLWGDEDGDEPSNKNFLAAMQIASIVRQDRALNGRFTVHLQTTRSHAKIMMVDTEDGWIAAVGSCNWLSTPFGAVELTAVLRDPAIVADAAAALQQLVGRRGLSDSVATEMALAARDLRRAGSAGGPVQIAIIAGEMHDQVMRTVSGSANRQLCIGSNRLGSTARPGALMQGEAAAGRGGVSVTVLYTKPSGPIKARHARELAEEAARNGVRLVKTRKIPLHGKFIAWDDDDLVVTSLNWASASSDPDFPWADIGVHVRMQGLAAAALERLSGIFPELVDNGLRGAASEAGRETAGAEPDHIEQ